MGNLINTTWQPVEDGNEFNSQDGGYLSLHGQKLVVTGTNRTRVYHTVKVELPDNVRICRRVEDTPITPEALEAAGWFFDDSIGTENMSDYIDEESPEWDVSAWTYDMQHLNIPKLLHVYFSARGKMNTIMVCAYSVNDDWEMAFPNCKTMQQLTDLVDFLGG